MGDSWRYEAWAERVEGPRYTDDEIEEMEAELRAEHDARCAASPGLREALAGATQDTWGDPERARAWSEGVLAALAQGAEEAA